MPNRNLLLLLQRILGASRIFLDTHRSELLEPLFKTLNSPGLRKEFLESLNLTAPKARFTATETSPTSLEVKTPRETMRAEEKTIQRGSVTSEHIRRVFGEIALTIFQQPSESEVSNDFTISQSQQFFYKSLIEELDFGTPLAFAQIELQRQSNSKQPFNQEDFYKLTIDCISGFFPIDTEIHSQNIAFFITASLVKSLKLSLNQAVLTLALLVRVFSTATYIVLANEMINEHAAKETSENESGYFNELLKPETLRALGFDKDTTNNTLAQLGCFLTQFDYQFRELLNPEARRKSNPEEAHSYQTYWHLMSTLKTIKAMIPQLFPDKGIRERALHEATLAALCPDQIQASTWHLSQIVQPQEQDYLLSITLGENLLEELRALLKLMPAPTAVFYGSAFMQASPTIYPSIKPLLSPEVLAAAAAGGSFFPPFRTSPVKKPSSPLAAQPVIPSVVEEIAIASPLPTPATDEPLEPNSPVSMLILPAVSSATGSEPLPQRSLAAGSIEYSHISEGGALVLSGIMSPKLEDSPPMLTDNELRGLIALAQEGGGFTPTTQRLVDAFLDSYSSYYSGAMNDDSLQASAAQVQPADSAISASFISHSALAVPVTPNETASATPELRSVVPEGVAQPEESLSTAPEIQTSPTAIAAARTTTGEQIPHVETACTYSSVNTTSAAAAIVASSTLYHRTLPKPKPTEAIKPISLLEVVQELIPEMGLLVKELQSAAEAQPPTRSDHLIFPKG